MSWICYAHGFYFVVPPDGWSPGGSDRLTPSHGTHSKPRRPAEHAHSSQPGGFWLPFMFKLYGSKVIEVFMRRRGCCYRPGFARRLRNSFNGNRERGTKCKRNCCHCGRCYAKHKSTKLAKKHFRFNFVSLFSSVLVQYSLKSILWNLFYSVVVILATSSGQ